MGNMQDLRI